MKKSIAVFCGGRGATRLIRYLRDKHELKLIINPYDDGLSTGEIRNIFNILGPSDIRKNIPALLEEKLGLAISELFEKRLTSVNNIDDCIQFLDSFVASSVNKKYPEVIFEFARNSAQIFRGKRKELVLNEAVAAGNLLLVSAFLGDVQAKLDMLLSRLGSPHRILINSPDNLYLVAQSRSLRLILNESEIVSGRSNAIVKDLYLLRKEDLMTLKELSDTTNDIEKVKRFLLANKVSPSANASAVEEIKKADAIIFSTGTMNSSIYPTLLTSNICKEVSRSRAKKFFIVNIGADYETPDYKASDFLSELSKYANSYESISLSDIVDVVYVNKSRPINSKPTSVILDESSSIWDTVRLETGDYEDSNNLGFHSNIVFQKIYEEVS
jgi:2-phospho-L-lactate transferase/gluconeogenesis factor (CofD/UPF0052 family)